MIRNAPTVRNTPTRRDTPASGAPAFVRLRRFTVELATSGAAVLAKSLRAAPGLLFAASASALAAVAPLGDAWPVATPEEHGLSSARLEGSWRAMTLLLMAGHFAIPFFYLMGRAVKRRGTTLAVGGVWLLAMHYMDLYWQVMPTLHADGVHPSALDVAAFLAVGGCFVAAAGWLMRRQALVPLGDPRLAESLAFESSHGCPFV